MIFYRKHFYIIYLLLFSACSDSKQNHNIIEPKVDCEETDYRSNNLNYYLEQAEDAISNNNDSLFVSIAEWFILESGDPWRFTSCANRMAMINNSKFGFYYYFYIYDCHSQINPEDKNLVNQLFWYLAKSKELGMKFDENFCNDFFEVELEESDYYLERF